MAMKPSYSTSIVHQAKKTLISLRAKREMSLNYENRRREPHTPTRFYTHSMSTPEAVNSISWARQVPDMMNLMNTNSSVAFASHPSLSQSASSGARDVVEHILPRRWRWWHGCPTCTVSLETLANLCCWIFHWLAR